MREEWDIPRLNAMGTYWESHPPVHLMVAAYFGIKPKEVQKQEALSAEDLMKVFATMPGAAPAPMKPASES